MLRCPSSTPISHRGLGKDAGHKAKAELRDWCTVGVGGAPVSPKVTTGWEGRRGPTPGGGLVAFRQSGPLGPESQTVSKMSQREGPGGRRHHLPGQVGLPSGF